VLYLYRKETTDIQYQPIKFSIMEDKLITLKNYETMVEAMFDQEILKENNIESSINNEDSVELLPMFGEINDGLRLVVFEKDYEQAIKILEEYENAVDSSPQELTTEE
jgi:hypothetical protein